jgi:hypothetical protein
LCVKREASKLRLSKATSLAVQLAAESTIDHVLRMMDSSLSIKELWVSVECTLNPPCYWIQNVLTFERTYVPEMSLMSKHIKSMQARKLTAMESNPKSICKLLALTDVHQGPLVTLHDITGPL